MTADPLPSLRAEIDLPAVRHNLGVVRARAAGADVLGVVKADAYGHGAVAVSRLLRAQGVERLAVATLDEAAELREAGLDGPLLVFGAPRPRQLGLYRALGLELTVSSVEIATALAEAAPDARPPRVHLKVDTGMHRLGVPPEAAPETLARLRAAGLDVVGLWSHLATADGADPAFAAEQARRFQAVLDAVEAPPLVHLLNGPAAMRGLGALRLPPGARGVVRAGGALYGLASDAALAAAHAELRPAMRLVSDVVHLQTVAPGETVSYGRAWRADRPTRVATLAAGYADGVPRALSNGGRVGIGGRLWPIAGRVCMDMLMVDLGDPDGPGGAVALGDEAVLWGPGGPTAEAQAARAGTIAYELTAGLTGRVARVAV